jgi:negative regulator of sigma E activity
MMTNKGKEKLSAFLDNDLHQDELMSFSLSSEPEHAKLAQRYQIMGDVMRDELSDASFVDVSQAVREALADETIEIEQPAQAELKSAPKDVSSGWDLAAWFRPAAGMAAAALVAVVMVVTLSSQETGGLSPVADNAEKKPAVMTADVKAIDNKATVENSKELQPYVNQHLEYATQDTLQGRLPFVRAVSYEAEK